MKKSRESVVAGVVCALLGVVSANAGTMTINPPNGVETNVLELIDGTTDVAVNTGALNGGIVHLNSFNTYAGETSLGCGTLAVKHVAEEGAASDLGASGLVRVGPGTFRYEGPAGAVIDRTFTNDVPMGSVCVYDIRSDLTITGDVLQQHGGFVKTGPGTLHLASSGINQLQSRRGTASTANYKKIDSAADMKELAFNTNGDAPTNGIAGFVLAEGTLVLGENGGTNYICRDDYFPKVGVLTTKTGQEKSAVLDIRGGYTRCFQAFYIAAQNGNAHGAEPVRSGLRMSAGKFDLPGVNFYLGRNRLNDSYEQQTYPFIEMTGGTLVCSKLSVAPDKGAFATIDVSGGTLNATNQIIFFENTDGPMSGELTVSGSGQVIAGEINAGNGSGNQRGRDGTLQITVRDGGLLRIWTGHNKWASCSERVDVLNGGVLSIPSLYNNGVKGGTLTLHVDGGVLESSLPKNSDAALLPSAVQINGGVTVGTRGVTLRALNASRESRINSDFAYTNTVAGMSPAGVRFEGGAGTYFLFGTVPQSYPGPTYIGDGYTIGLKTDSDLPPNSPVTLAPRGAIRPLTRAHTLASLTLAGDGAHCLQIPRGASLVVRDAFVAQPGATLTFELYEGDDCGAWLQTPGTYTLLTVPASSRAALEGVRLRHQNPLVGVDYAFAVVESGGTVSWQVTVASRKSPEPTVTDVWTSGAGDGAWATGGNWQSDSAVNAAGTVAMFARDAAAGGDAVAVAAPVTLGGFAFSGANGYAFSGAAFTLDNSGAVAGVSATAGTNVFANAVTLAGDAAFTTTDGAALSFAGGVSGSGTLAANENKAGGGRVDFGSSLSGFTGRLRTGGGTVASQSLAFADAADDLVLGSGTFLYTGGDASLAGLRIDAGGLPCIFTHDADLSVGSIDMSQTGSGAFFKRGAGTLTLDGDGPYLLGNASQMFPGDPETASGVPANGDAPTVGFCSATVNEGRLVIGSATSAPHVRTEANFGVGGFTTHDPNAATAGELVVENGVLDIGGGASALNVGYYVAVTPGRDPSLPPLEPKLTLNGGEVHCGSLALANSSSVTNYVAPQVEINGGTLTCSGWFVTYLRGGESRVTVNGGMLDVHDSINLAEALSTPVKLYVNEGGTVRATTVTAKSDAVGANTEVHFDGGTFKPLVRADSGTSYFRYMGFCGVSEKGVVFDTSDCDLLGGSTETYINVQKPFLREEGQTARGTVTVRGKGIVAFGSTFAGSEVDLHVENGGTIVTVSGSTDGLDATLDGGANLRNYNENVAKFRNLTLGTADGPAMRLDVLNTATPRVTVSGELSVAGPVQVAFRRNFNEPRTFASGTYTALVFQASSGTVDLSKFALGSECFDRVATFTTAPVTGGAYDGWTAIVMTVAAGTPAGAPVWTSVQTGGDWTSSANWNGATPPNGVGQAAAFNAATAVGVPVNLDADVAIGRMTLAGAANSPNGYVFDGAQTLTLPSDNDGMGLFAMGGTHRINAPLDAARSAAVNAAAGATVEVAGAVTGNGTLKANVAYPTGGGTVKLTSASSFAGGVQTGGGRVESASLAFADAPAKLQLGAGTFAYTGPATTLGGLTIASGSVGAGLFDTAADVTLQSADSASGALVKTGAGALRLTGPGPYTLGKRYVNQDSSGNTRDQANGDGPTCGFRGLNVAEGLLQVGSAETAPEVSIPKEFAVGGLARGARADFTLDGGRVDVGDKMYVGYSSSCDAAHPFDSRVTVNGGELNVGTTLRIQQTIGGVGSARFTVNGGAVNVGSNVEMSKYNGACDGYYATLEINGGEMYVGGQLWCGGQDEDQYKTQPAPHGRVYVNGGLLDVSDYIWLTHKRDKSTTVEFWLNPGGTLKAKRITKNSDSPNGRLYFNGGEYFQRGSATDAAAYKWTGSILVYASTNGIVLNTSEFVGDHFEIAVNSGLQHDPALGATRDGGLTKRGLKPVWLSNKNTYTGPTRVEEGELRIKHAQAIGEDVEVVDAGILDLNGATLAVTNLTGSALVRNGTLRVLGRLAVDAAAPTPGDVLTSTANIELAAGATLALDVASDNQTCDVLNVEGDWTLGGKIAVDFGRTADEPIPFNTRLELARVTGAVTGLPGTLRAEGTGGTASSLKVERVGDRVYGTLMSGGTLLIFR